MEQREIKILHHFLQLVQHIYFYFAEYDLREAINRTKRQLAKLQPLIMDGDYIAAELAMEQLAHLDKLNKE